ncbi:MAG: transcription elongation factor GreA [Candidatus Omnitrophica bacterium]|nr:transcription elongation factor GreA [Candidatus Omnitrophota bacterium]
MGSGRINLTREGYNKLQQELEYLSGEKRRVLAANIGEAREKGDLSENAEYDAAREDQGMNEKRIAELEDILTRSRILDDTAMAKDEALLGAIVKVKDRSSGEKIDYMLVSEEESDFDLNKISVSSPVGKALLGHKVDDIVEVNVPAGIIEYKIVKISR